MSNPAVIELISEELSIGSFRIEDNIGESIHVHLGEIRIDLTVNDFHEIAEEMRSAINHFVDIKGFDCNMYDPFFLTQIAEYLPDLIDCQIVNEKISDLYTCVFKRFGGIEYRPISQSRVIKALSGDTTEDDAAKQINNYGISNNARTNMIFDSIKNNGYPYNNKYAVVFGDCNFVRDGQHRLSVVCKLSGEDTRVPIIKMVFRDNKHGMNRHPRLDYLFKWDRRRVKKAVVLLKKTLVQITRSTKSRLFFHLHKKKLNLD